MNHTTCPTGTDLARRLFSAGLISAPPTDEESQFDIESAADAAAVLWQEMTGFIPFLAESANSTHYFDGDGSYTVDLLGGFVSIASVTINGNACTLNTDYRTMPRNAALLGRPITYLKFGGRWGSFRPFPANPTYAGPVAVTGKRGAYTNIPSIAWEAMLALGTGYIIDQSEFAKFGGVKSWKSGTTEEVYDLTAFDRLIRANARTVANGLSLRRMRVA